MIKQSSPWPKKIERLRTTALAGGITRAQALAIGRIPTGYLPRLWAIAGEMRDAFLGRAIRLCSIVNAKSGRCAEDCAFCAQSAHHRTGVKTYPLMDVAGLVKAGNAAFAAGAGEFSIVTSGTRVNEHDLAVIEKAVARLAKRHPGKDLCASLGMISAEGLARLKRAGLRRFHHNLETSRGHFPRICTTHAYDESIRTVRAAAAAGLKVCSGGIFGMGENWQGRVDLAWEARRLPTAAFPVNFLNPIPGTPLARQPVLEPLEALRIIAMVRLVLPDRNVIICGGKERALGQMLPLIFTAGANGILIGGYLTTQGRTMADDIAMVREAGFKIVQ
ncbi:MAG: biotin synthase BioB [Planctomycetota bacterium]